jgi:hypothetical protein
MKKRLHHLLLLLAALSTGQTFAQCNELFFSEYLEGFFNNKALEIANPGNAAVDLANYRIVRWSNGATNSSSLVDYVQPLSGSIPAHGVWVCFLDRRNPASTGADTILNAELLAIADGFVANGVAAYYSPNYNAVTAGAKVLSFNGDDAFSLDKNVGGTWTKVDIFGKIGERPVNATGGTSSPTGAWTDTPPYNDGQGIPITRDWDLLRRPSVKSGVTTNPTVFNALAEWDTAYKEGSHPAYIFSNLGWHVCDCPNAFLGVKETVKAASALSLSPNPSVGQLLVRSDKGLSQVVFFDAGGRLIKQEKNMLANNLMEFDLSGFTPGMYFIQALYTDGSSGFSKCIVR